MPKIKEMGRIVVPPSYRGIGLFYESRIIEPDEGRGIHRTTLRALWKSDKKTVKDWFKKCWEKREQSREFPAGL